ncbi:MAG: ribulose-phosphate 3-epimerase [Bacteroidales bacterium]|nr:ribulose-phosphate 3-epimerase [Bacteroidales bacterium]
MNEIQTPNIAPSLLSADFCNLQKDIAMVNQSEAEWFHLDIMDGVFVPNISFGLPVVKAIRSQAEKPLDVHLMIVQPERYVTAFAEAGADMLTVHYEASTHLHRTLTQIKNENMLAGVALNPHTPVSLLEDVLENTDLVLIMSVNPGFGGQKFIERSLSKVAALRDMIDKRGLETLIEVDGGVNLDNAPRLVEAGADILVVGNTVFKSDNPVEMIHKLKGDL